MQGLNESIPAGGFATLEGQSGLEDASFNRFRELIDALPAAIYTTDAKGRLTHFNPACVAFSGRTPTLGSDHWCVTWKLYYPDGRPMRHEECPMAVTLKTGQVVRGAEAIAERPDGTRIWFTPYPTPLFDDAGNVTGGINMLVDITERKDAEQQKRQHDERYHRLIEMLPVGVYSIEAPSGRIAYFNQQAARLWGRAPNLADTTERFCGSRRVFLPNGKHVPHDQCPMAIAMRDGQSFRNLDVIMERADGSRFFAVVNIDPIHDGAGNVIGAVNAFRDITEIKEAEQAVRHSERELSDFFENASIGLHWVGPDGAILRVNQAELDMLGYTRDEYVGRHVADFHVDRPAIEDILTRLACGEVIHQYPARLRHKDGSIRHVLINSSVLFENGQFIHTRCFTTDVTERYRAEEEMRRAKQEADDANRAKDRFLAVLSHELRTPLTPVLMAVAALEKRPDTPADLREDFAMIRRNVELQSRLIDDLLDLSRIASGKLRLSFEAHSINDLVRHACETCRSNVRERGIQLYCDLDPDVLDVVGDGSRLQQVFWNLLNNATKFTPEGGQIYVRTENVAGSGAGDERVRVTVRDTGVGIEKEALERIFDAFEQARPVEESESSFTRRFGGMGLGLAICRTLVKHHHGAICAHSDGKGKGSTFVVELPALPRPADVGMMAQSHSAGQESVCPLRLLVVEDHPDTALMLGRLLAASGHSVTTANTAADALKISDEHPFDLVISDLGLPDMTGYDLMRQITERSKSSQGGGRGLMRGIAMSGYGMEEDIRKSELAGFSDHLVKPVNFAQLEQSISRIIANGNATDGAHGQVRVNTQHG